MSLLPLFQWMENLGFSVFIRESAWIGPVVNVIHIVILVVLTGAILVVDLRLLGGGMRTQSIAQVTRDARPWFLGALLGMLITGIPQLTSTAIKQYYNPYFWGKMEVLLVALIFTFTLKRKVTMAPEGRVKPIWARLVGLVSMALWSAVATQGRLIGLLG